MAIFLLYKRKVFIFVKITSMKEKLLALMQNEGLKPSRLAEMLDVNPAGISHILNGRNKPGFDFLQKILRRFPRISPDWLLLDSGPMYRDTEASPLDDARGSNAATADRQRRRTPTGRNNRRSLHRPAIDRLGKRAADGNSGFTRCAHRVIHAQNPESGCGRKAGRHFL